MAVTLFKLVSNQSPREWEVRRERWAGIVSVLRALCTWGQSIRAQCDLGGGARNRGASNSRRDEAVVRACGGQGVGPL